MKFLCLSDIHGASTKSLIEEIDNTEIDVVLISGDLTQKGAEKEALEVIKPFLTWTFPLFCVPGNMDMPGVNKLLQNKEIDLHGKGIVFQNIGLFGCGGSNPTPFSTPQELSEEEISQSLEQAYDSIKKQSVKLLLCHTPPFNTHCDRIGSGEHCGSRALRSFLENHDIDFCLCGHIHESYGQDRVGKTLCINPGAFQQGRWVIVENTGHRFKIKRSNI